MAEKEIEKEIFNLSSSESEEREESIVENMPRPDQEPPRPPDLEVIRNRRSQSHAKSVRSQTQMGETKNDYAYSNWFNSFKTPEETWRDRRAESAQREQKRKEEFWYRESEIPRLRRVKSTPSVNEVGA
jgi:hypothetical protein